MPCSHHHSYVTVYRYHERDPGIYRVVGVLVWPSRWVVVLMIRCLLSLNPFPKAVVVHRRARIDLIVIRAYSLFCFQGRRQQPSVILIESLGM